jgi:drug/metabolite transporter (DMT)-like permease
MSGPSHLRLYSLIGAMVTFFSLNYIVARFALREFPPMQLTAVRTAVAAVILVALWLGRATWGGAVRRGGPSVRLRPGGVRRRNSAGRCTAQQPSCNQGTGGAESPAQARPQAKDECRPYLRIGRPLWLRPWSSLPHISRNDLFALALLGIFGITLNQLLFAFGLQRTSVAHASLLSALAPIMVLLIAALIGQERITVGKLAGMLIAIIGVAILQMDPGKRTIATLAGDVIILLSALAIALYSIIGKHVTARHDIVTVNAVSYLAGLIALLPLLLPPRGFSYAAVSAAGWLSLLYMAVFPSVLGYLIYCYALTHMPASRVSAFSYLQPLLATILAVPMLGEPVTGSLAGGGALVLLGVYVTERG